MTFSNGALQLHVSALQLLRRQPRCQQATFARSRQYDSMLEQAGTRPRERRMKNGKVHAAGEEGKVELSLQ